MTIVYFDSSAYVKLVVEEEGSDLAAALWDGCDAAGAAETLFAVWDQRLRTEAEAAGVRLAPMA